MRVRIQSPNTPERVAGCVKDSGRAASVEDPNKDEKGAQRFAKIMDKPVYKTSSTKIIFYNAVSVNALHVLL